jgi:hypothetical protein
VLSSPAASTISSLTASSSASVVRRQQINSSNHIIGRQQNSILNFFPKIDASRDFVKDPFGPVNIKSPELMSCEQEILDSHRTAELIQKRRKIKSLKATATLVTLFQVCQWLSTERKRDVHPWEAKLDEAHYTRFPM